MRREAPAIANLYCAAIEFFHVQKLLTNDLVKHDIIRNADGLQFNLRLVDDMMSPANAAKYFPTPEQYGLRYSETQRAETVCWAGIELSLKESETSLRGSTYPFLTRVRSFQYICKGILNPILYYQFTFLLVRFTVHFLGRILCVRMLKECTSMRNSFLKSLRKRGTI